MPSNRLFFRFVLGAVALALPLACSRSSLDHPTGVGGSGGSTGGTSGAGGGVAGQQGDGRHFVPEDLPNTLAEGQVGVTLELIAFTLLQRPMGPELYAAVRNSGTSPSCEAGMTTELFDKAGQLVTSSGVGLQGGRFYRLDDGFVITCIDPGQIAMTAATNLPDDLVVADLGHLTHRFPTFGVADLTPVGGALTVTDVETIPTGAGTIYRGTFTNGLDVPARTPKVTIYPVNRVGRPLGVTTASGSTDLPPGGTWTFETTAVEDAGVDYAAFPAASIGD